MIKYLVFLLIFVANIYANQTVKIGFVKNMPPYTFDSDSGIELEVIKASLEKFDYTVEPTYVSFKRGKKALQDSEIDGMTTMLDDGDKDIYYSDDYIEYHNFAFSLKDNNITLSKVDDLKGKSIVTWQDAHTMLGKDFYNFFNPNVKDEYIKKYREMVDQSQQNKLFWSSRVDVVILDSKIFLYYKKALSKELDTNKEYNMHNIIGNSTMYKVAFKDKKIKIDFNRGLAMIKQDGTYQKILDKYK